MSGAFQHDEAQDPWGGGLPSGWRVQTLGEICDRNDGRIQTGPFGSQLHAADYIENGVPSVMPKDIVGDRINDSTIARVSQADADRLSLHRLEVGDVVYARRGDIGRRALVTATESGWLCGTGCLRIRLNSAEVSPEYLFAYLGHPVLRKWVEDRALGATMLNLNTGILRAVPLRFPAIAEQRRIADILYKADALRVKRRAALAQLDTLTQAIFIEMFGDPVTNPKCWERRTLGSLLPPGETVSYGVVQPGGDFDDGVPLIRAGDLEGGVIRRTALKRIDPVIEAAYKRSRLIGDEILVSCVGSIGQVAVADASVAGFNVARAVARLRIGERASRSFVAAYLRTDCAQAYFRSELRTVAQPTLNIKQLAELPLYQPPRSLQDAFDGPSRLVEHVRSKYASSLTELDALFASLQHRAFRGEL